MYLLSPDHLTQTLRHRRNPLPCSRKSNTARSEKSDFFFVAFATSFHTASTPFGHSGLFDHSVRSEVEILVPIILWLFHSFKSQGGHNSFSGQAGHYGGGLDR